MTNGLMNPQFIAGLQIMQGAGVGDALIQQQELQQAQAEMARQQQLREAMSGIDFSNPAAIEQVMRLDPQTGIQLMEVANKRMQQERLQQQSLREQDAVQRAQQQGITEQEAYIYAESDNPTLAGLAKQKLAQIESDREQRKTALAPTKGEEAIDKAFAKTYADYYAAGGRASATKNLQALIDAKNELQTSDISLTGAEMKAIPTWAEDIVAPRSKALRERVEEVVQRNLREVLGAQFTEKEGERLISRAFNPNLDEAENISRLNSLIAQVQQAIEAKDDAARYFEENGTLKGWTGKLYKSVDDFTIGKTAPTGQIKFLGFE